MGAWLPSWSNAVFSLEERDRRWAKVRRLMADASIDVIVALPCTTNHDRGQQDARYLTQLGENSDETTAVFPAEAPVVCWHSRAGIWPSGNWVDEIRANRRGTGGRTVVEYLQEIGFSSGTIAVAGLTSSLLARVRAGEGEVNWQSVQLIKEAFPHCQVVSATPVLGEARYQKSAEEIDFLRKGTEIAERTAEAVATALRPGVAEREVFAEMYRANAAAGGSFTPMFGWISGPLGHTNHRVEQPAFRTLERGDELSLEIEGRWGGYIAQIDQVYYLGRAPAELRDGTKLALEAFDGVMAALKPGVTVSELCSAGARTALGGRARSELVMHGRGTGDDGPLVVPAQLSDEVRGVEIKEHCSFVIKPSVSLDGRPDYGHWGETVVVRSQGAQRLGTRAPGLTECQ
jgi:Xaa-Pro dipeptidase